MSETNAELIAEARLPQGATRRRLENVALDLAVALEAAEAEREAAFELAAASAESNVKAQGHCSGCDMALVIAADIRARRFFK